MTPARVIAGLVIVGDAAAPELCRIERSRQPEVEHFHYAIGRDLDVGRLEIAVHDAAVVCGLERISDLFRETECFFSRYRPARRRLRERIAFDQFHDQGTNALRVGQAIDVRDVWMIEGGQNLGLSLEARQAFRIAGQVEGRILSATSRFNWCRGSIHLAHAASAQGETIS